MIENIVSETLNWPIDNRTFCVVIGSSLNFTFMKMKTATMLTVRNIFV